MAYAKETKEHILAKLIERLTPYDLDQLKRVQSYLDVIDRKGPHPLDPQPM